jgi:hypothetical protein
MHDEEIKLLATQAGAMLVHSWGGPTEASGIDIYKFADKIEAFVRMSIAYDLEEIGSDADWDTIINTIRMGGIE